MFAATGDIVTHYLEGGSSSRSALVFVNSLGTDLRMWEPVAALLASDYRSVRYDKRGHGLSDCPPGPYSLEQLAADLSALLTHLGIEAAALVGISVGGMIALQFALDQPNLVRALVLADTAARIGTVERWNQRIATVHASGMERAAPEIIPIWFTEGFAEAQPAVHRGYLNMMARTPAEGYTATCAALRDGDLTGRLAELQTPTLVLAGEHDVATPPELGRQLAASLPEARFQLIDGAAHLVSVEQPQAVAGAIRTFLQELGYV